MSLSESKTRLLKQGVWLFFTVAWIAMVAVLITGALNQPRGKMRAPEELLKGVHLPAESTWMGVYVNNEKIGFVRSEVEPLKSSGYELREFSRLQGAMMGAMQQMRVRMTIVTDSTLAMRSFDGRVEVENYLTTFAGRIEDKVLQIEVINAGQKTEKAIPAPEPIYMSQAIKPLLQAGRLAKGDSLKLAGFDPMKLEMQEMTVIGAALEPQRLWGEDVLARKLTTYLAGFESTVYVDAQGNTLAEYGPMGLTMRREDEETALAVSENDIPVDFLTIYSIKPRGKIHAPRRAERCEFEITGYDLNLIEKASDRQSLDMIRQNVVFVNRRSTPPPQPPEKLLYYKLDAPFIESRSPQIRAAAIAAVRGGTSMLDSLDKLNWWVFKAVDKKPSAGLPSAVGVLEKREGDCNEHAVLFTALARSLGVPTRLQMGVVYQGDRFYYHAWVACWLEDRWIEFDPTFGQDRADAARIALTSGNLMDSVDLIKAIGNIEIGIVKVE